MNKLISTLMVLLSLAVLAVLFASLFVTYQKVSPFSIEKLDPKDFYLLPAVAISSGVLVAILAYARDRRKHEIEQQRHMSEVILERVKAGFETTIRLLSDQNNNRLTWVRASRTLLKALELKDLIQTEEYKIAYRVEEERARSELYVILSTRDPKTGERVPLPPQFFYGISDWAAKQTLDEAAIKSSTGPVVYAMSLDEVPPQPSLKPISPRSITAIFGFLEYPDDFADPLSSVEVWDDDWTKSHGMDQGARRYVEHTKQKTAIGGKLVEKKQASKS